MTPRLLADLVAAATIWPPLRRWADGDEPALVSIVNAGTEPVPGTPVTIGVSERLADAVTVIVDGTAIVPPQAARPPDLHDLVVELAEAHGVEVD
jgi:hypothetical protein